MVLKNNSIQLTLVGFFLLVFDSWFLLRVSLCALWSQNLFRISTLVETSFLHSRSYWWSRVWSWTRCWRDRLYEVLYQIQKDALVALGKPHNFSDKKLAIRSLNGNFETLNQQAMSYIDLFVSFFRNLVVNVKVVIC